MPTTYFNMGKKKRGISGNKKLMDLKIEDFEDELFWAEITRRCQGSAHKNWQRKKYPSS